MAHIANSTRLRVLVTGAAGYIAGINLPALRSRHDLTLLDLRAARRDGTPLDGVIEYDLAADVQGGYHPSDRLRAMFRGVDAVFHCAYVHSNWKTLDGYETERGNVDLAYLIYRLAHEEGVRRVIVASSNHAADWYETPLRDGRLELLGPEMPAYSDNWYGWAKVSYEQMGFVFASGAFGRALEVVQLRIGAPRAIEADRFSDNTVGYRRDLGAWLTDRDFQQLLLKSLETPDIRNEFGVPFQIFYGISNNTRAFWSIRNARRVIGYAPQDDSEVTYAEDIRRLLTDAGRRGRLSDENS
ncbi:MAG: NAD-dependent epimerase/dehydratase family protein [Chloroflexota bacterium]